VYPGYRVTRVFHAIRVSRKKKRISGQTWSAATTETTEAKSAAKERDMLGVDKIRRPAAARTHPLANALMLVLGAGLVYIAASRAAAENATALKPEIDALHARLEEIARQQQRADETGKAVREAARGISSLNEKVVASTGQLAALVLSESDHFATAWEAIAATERAVNASGASVVAISAATARVEERLVALTSDTSSLLVELRAARQELAALRSEAAAARRTPAIATASTAGEEPQHSAVASDPAAEAPEPAAVATEPPPAVAEPAAAAERVAAEPVVAEPVASALVSTTALPAVGGAAEVAPAPVSSVSEPGSVSVAEPGSLADAASSADVNPADGVSFAAAGSDDVDLAEGGVSAAVGAAGAVGTSEAGHSAA